MLDLSNYFIANQFELIPVHLNILIHNIYTTPTFNIKTVSTSIHIVKEDQMVRHILPLKTKKLIFGKLSITYHLPQ